MTHTVVFAVEARRDFAALLSELDVSYIVDMWVRGTAPPRWI